MIVKTIVCPIRILKVLDSLGNKLLAGMPDDDVINSHRVVTVQAALEVWKPTGAGWEGQVVGMEVILIS